MQGSAGPPHPGGREQGQGCSGVEELVRWARIAVEDEDTPVVGLKEGEDLNLRIFIDRPLVEIFVNGRPAASMPLRLRTPIAWLIVLERCAGVTGSSSGYAPFRW